jgi:cobalt-zinc-cadmium efflux system membrane fusion protein
MNLRKIYLETLLICFTLVIWGCSKNYNSTETKTDIVSDTLSLPKEMESNIKTTLPVSDDLNDEIILAGKVSFNPNEISKIFPLASGIMTRIFVNVGDIVRRGQILAQVYSNDFANSLSDFRKAESQLDVSNKNYLRVEKLAESNISSQKDLEQAKRDLDQAQYEYDRALKNLRLLGGNENSNSATYYVRAPIDGIILERTAQIGTQIRNDGSQNLFTVGKTNNVWVFLDLYQDQFDRVRKGDPVTLKFTGIEDSVYETTIRNISPNIDPTKMTAQVRCELDNSNNMLKPEMFCSALVKHRKGSSTFVPSSAVFFDSDGKNYVFVKIGEGKYFKKEIQTGQKNSQKTEIIKGISMTENLVADKTIFLNEELKNSTH